MRTYGVISLISAARRSLLSNGSAAIGPSPPSFYTSFVGKSSIVLVLLFTLGRLSNRVAAIEVYYLPIAFFDIRRLLRSHLSPFLSLFSNLEL